MPTSHHDPGGRFSLTDLPWRFIRRAAYALRRRLFTVAKPDKDGIVVTLSIDEIRLLLGVNYFNPRWALSYQYHGEDLNMRRYYYDPDRDLPHRQVHVRGFEVADGVQLLAHEEPAPEHHPRAHLRSKDMRDATQGVTDLLLEELSH